MYKAGEKVNNRKYDKILAVHIVYLPKKFDPDEQEPRRRMIADWDSLKEEEQKVVREIFMRWGGYPE